MRPNLILYAGIICLINIMLIKFITTAAINTITQKRLINQEEVTYEMQTNENVQDKDILSGNQQQDEPQIENTSLAKISPRARPEPPTMYAVKELTLALRRYSKNAMGNWVYNPWGLTLGKVWQDTRFNMDGKVTRFKVFLDSELVEDYLPELNDLSTVCIKQSKVYNVPPVRKWLVPHWYTGVHKTRPVMRQLRRDIYNVSRSEECHTTAYVNFLEFQECHLRRHQRCESLVPNYPRHQKLWYNN